MQLIDLKLNNFMGIKEYNLQTGGGDVAVYGDNGAGKTTLFSAFTWLLRGKDSSNRADFAIKTIGPDGQPLPGLNHSVEGIFTLDSGMQLILKKTYKETYTRKRGAARAEFSGHNTEHYVDGVPVQKKEYDKTISDIMPSDEAFMLLTNPRYFNDHLHWEQRRALLLNICGDVDDADVIASNEELKQLPAILDGRPVDAHRKVVTAGQREINSELKEIPARIDEVTRGLPRLPALKKADINDNIEVMQALIDKKDSKRRELAAGGGAIELKVELADIDGKIRILKSRLQQEAQSGREPVERARVSLTGRVADTKHNINAKQNILSDIEHDLANAAGSLNKLQKDYKTIDAEELTDSVDNVCNACGQQLPADKVEQARAKAKAQFNAEKAGKLEAYANSIEQRESSIKAMKANKKQLIDTIAAQKKDLKRLEKELAGLPEPGPAPVVDVDSNAEYIGLMEQRQTVEEQLQDLHTGKQQQADTLAAEIADTKSNIAGLQQQLSQFDQHDKGMARIQELRDYERELAGNYEKLERELDLIDKFTRRRVDMLTDKINDNFKLARFKLFNVNINGGIEPTCETIYNGVEWHAGLNNGMQLNVGIDIINTLAGFYNMAAPVFIDNAESVTDIIGSEAQLIKLVVSEKDKELRVVKTKRRSK